jgi:hypothetical protein
MGSHDMRHASPRFRHGRALVLGLAATFVMAQASAAAVTVKVEPATASLAPLATRQFQANVTGADNTAVHWLVNGIAGGAPSVGLISASGLYTAPADVPDAFQVQVEAQSAAAPLDYGAVTVKLAASTATGPVFHVAITGKDSNPGTAAEPWRTIQHAADKVPAGGTVWVHTGTYKEVVTISRSGSASAGFITLRAAPGETPVVDGTNLPVLPPNFENGLFTLSDVSFVRLIGFEVQNYRTNSATDVPIGIFVTGAGSNIEILNNHVHNIVTTVKTSVGDALGLLVWGTNAPAALSNLIIDGNELDDLTTGFSESLAISGNVQNFQVTNNLIHDNDNIGIDIAGYEGVAPPAFDRARNGYVANNTVFNISSIKNPAYDDPQPSYGADGIYVDGGEYVVIERNLVHNTDIGIEAASEHPGKFSNAVTIRNNVVYASNIVGLTIGGTDPNMNGGTTNCVIVNNTLVGDDTTMSGLGELQIQNHASGNVFYNNIASATVQGLLLNSIASLPNPPAFLDKNLYDSPLGRDGSQWTWLGTTWTGFAVYVKHTPNDHHSLFANPDFINAAVQNYQLAAPSPARNSGALLPLSEVGLFDFAGKPRTVGNAIDIGAYQN